jgi:hypothetical protein
VAHSEKKTGIRSETYDTKDTDSNAIEGKLIFFNERLRRTAEPGMAPAERESEELTEAK